jgi:hypothetical protein
MTIRRSLVGVTAGAVLAWACGPSTSSSVTPSKELGARASGEPAQGASAHGASAPGAQSTVSGRAALEDAEILERVKSDFDECYARGKKKTPEMTSGKVTWLASVDVSGRTTCVVPLDDTGLTQDVEDCMSARLERERFTPGAPWSFELPIVASDGGVRLGRETTGPVLEDLSVHGLSDASEVVTSLLPKLTECVQPLDKSQTLRVIHVGARVGSDGSVACALTTATSVVPDEVRACTSAVLERARFKAPRSGMGLVSIPIKVL